MKRIGLVVAVVMMAVLGVFVQRSSAMGHFVADEKGVSTIAASQTVDGSAYMAGERVVVDGTVNGDLFCAASDIVITGTINGDVLCAGSTVILGGVVHGDVRAAGSDVTVKGEIDGNATVAGSNVTIDKAAAIGGDLTGGASNLVFYGTVGRDMLMGAASATIGGEIGRDLNAEISELSFVDGGAVGGDLRYRSDAQAAIPQGAVAGKTEFSKTDQTSRNEVNPFVAGLGVMVAFVFFVVLVTLVLPKYVHEASSLSGRMVLVAFLAGFATLALLPVVSILLMITVVGVPAGLTLMVVWLLLLILSGVFTSYYAGGLVLQKRATNALLVALVGALVVGVLLWIPVINVIVALAMVCIGIGMQVLHIRHQFSHQPYKITNE